MPLSLVSCPRVRAPCLAALLALPLTIDGSTAQSTPEPYAAMARTVTIYRDEYGVPQVYGPTDASVVFGLAYAQAEDRLEQLEDQAPLYARGGLKSAWFTRQEVEANARAVYRPGEQPRPARRVGGG